MALSLRPGAGRGIGVLRASRGRTVMATQTIDQAKLEAFGGKVFGDIGGTFASLMCVLGDRLGLFKDLAAHGPATSAELAARAGVTERYAREWLGGMASAGYLEYDPTARRFTLPPEHAAILAEEDGPMFFGGLYEMVPSWVDQLDRLEQSFRQGGGVPQAAYHDHMWDGLERLTNGWFENFLVQEWIPAMPDARAKLERGALVADVGCGRGRAAIKLALAYPNSRIVGYDAFAPTIARATANAEVAGVADRVRFVARDVVQGLPEQYDIITTFDVVHDAVDPLGLLRAICRGLRPDGIYVCVDVNASDKLEENAGPLGSMLHGSSLFYCMTTSLAHDGAALGTLGLHEPKMRELCAAAGFGAVRRVPITNWLNTLFEVRR
jgi:SAM-dependent methyltransferase